MNTISANELKTRGVTALEENLKSESEVIILVHGKAQYVVLKIQHYQHIRELELNQALLETQEDIKNKKFHTSIKKHIHTLKD